MTDELSECAAAFFRSIGKDVVTVKEFTMYVTLDVKWMSSAEAAALVNLLVEDGAMVRSNGYLKPGRDMSQIQVPVAYRPGDSLKKMAAEAAKKGTKQEKPKAPSADIFPELAAMSSQYGWDSKGKFIAECNAVRKKLGVDTSVAALLILRDSGADTAELAKRVYADSAGKN